MHFQSNFAKELADYFAIGTLGNAELMEFINQCVPDPEMYLMDGHVAEKVKRENIRFAPEELSRYFELAALGVEMAHAHDIQGYKLEPKLENIVIIDDKNLVRDGIKPAPYMFYVNKVFKRDKPNEPFDAICLTTDHIINSMLELKETFLWAISKTVNYPFATFTAPEMVTANFLEEARHLRQRLVPPAALEAHYASMPRNIPIHEYFKDMPNIIAEYNTDPEIDARNIICEEFLQNEGKKKCVAVIESYNDTMKAVWGSMIKQFVFC